MYQCSTSLASLLEQYQRLKVLTLEGLALDENICRVLGTFSRPDLKIELTLCGLTNAGASAFAEVLGRNQGPTKLESCEIDNIVLANGLRGKSRLKILSPLIFNGPGDCNRDVLAIAGALRENRDLVQLNLCCSQAGLLERSETWGAICESLATHPTLEVLNLTAAFTNAAMASVLESRIQALLKMVKMSTSIHTIHLNERQNGAPELFQSSALPYLETNWLRPRLLCHSEKLPNCVP
jgi:hypothetical protein